MRPLRQGSLDGLCGVYAVLNSLDLVGMRMPRCALHKELFQQLTCALGAAALLAAMHDGLDAPTLQRAAQIAFGWLAARHHAVLDVDLPFRGRRRFRSTAGFLKAVRAYGAMPNTAVIVAFGDQLRLHWTVVRELDGSDLLLRDSDGLRRLDTSSYGVGMGRRCFSPSDTLIIQRVS